MNRSEFLKNLSKLSREEINKIIRDNGKQKEKHKLVPVPFRIVIQK